MNRTFIVAGFIILFVGGLVYTFATYTTSVTHTVQSDEGTSGTISTTTRIGNSPLGVVIMFIGFTIVVVGLLYKPEEVKTLEVKQENP